MSSPNRSDLDQIERDLPTTEADVKFLRRLHHNQPVPFAEALQLLNNLDLFPVDPLSRPLAEGWEPFQL